MPVNTVKQMLQAWSKRDNAQRILNRTTYKDRESGRIVWRNPLLATKLMEAANA